MVKMTMMMMLEMAPIITTMKRKCKMNIQVKGMHMEFMAMKISIQKKIKMKIKKIWLEMNMVTKWNQVKK